MLRVQYGHRCSSGDPVCVTESVLRRGSDTIARSVDDPDRYRDVVQAVERHDFAYGGCDCIDRAHARVGHVDAAVRECVFIRWVAGSQRLRLRNEIGKLGRRLTPRRLRIGLAALQQTRHVDAGARNRDNRVPAERKTGGTDSRLVDALPERSVGQHRIERHRKLASAKPPQRESLHGRIGDAVVSRVIDCDGDEPRAREGGAEPRELPCGPSGSVRKQNHRKPFWGRRERSIGRGTTGDEKRVAGRPNRLHPFGDIPVGRVPDDPTYRVGFHAELRG